MSPIELLISLDETHSTIDPGADPVVRALDPLCLRPGA